MHDVNTKDTTPISINYATLEADVAAHAAAWVEQVRDDLGDEAAAATAAEFAAKPWLALQWFVEDNMPAEQRSGALPADKPFQPEYHDVEMNGEIVRCGNPDAIIQMMGQSNEPAALHLMANYEKALADLREANGGPATQFMRQEALQAAMAGAGIEVEEVGSQQQAASVQ